MSRRLKAIIMLLTAALTSTMLVANPQTATAAKVTTDKKAIVTVTPADGISAGKVTVKFSKSHARTNRPVQLQILKRGRWANVGDPVRVSSRGLATFNISPSDTAQYRGFAAKYSRNAAVVSAAGKSKTLVDDGAKTSINPVAGSSNGSIQVTFTKSHVIKNRAVQLYVVKSKKWLKVGKPVRMSSKGVALFKLSVNSNATYRGVAEASKKKLRVATPAVAAASRWKLQRDYSFSNALNNEWQVWQENEYTVRKCAANIRNNTTFSKGYANLRITDITSSDTRGKALAAGCETPGKIYGNAMVRTEGAFTMQSGIVAARIKFPKNRSMHGGIWLSPTTGSPEIDIIESYGYAAKNPYYSKTTSGIHQAMSVSGYKKLVTPRGWEKSYGSGLSQTVFNIRRLPDSWYNKYHVVSVEFTTSKLVFRMDGKITGTLNRSTPKTDYFLVMSLITTPWELKQAGGALKVPASMSVDWVRAWTKG